LAFLLGGSAAFGHFATSDATTITGYLNRLQDEYFFVNAGVPSWNSTQELSRLINQILDYKSALVMTYDGANDLEIMLDYYRKRIDYPPGTPESFEHLYALVDDVRAAQLSAPPLYERLFPWLTKTVRAHMGVSEYTERSASGVPDELIERTAARYVRNEQLMHDLSTAHGARFVGVFQPISVLHKGVPEDLRNPGRRVTYQKFHDDVFKRGCSACEYVDFSDFFDKPGSARYHEDTLFVDEVHVNDHGNELIAQGILHALHQD
jgi:hypothetical protein